MQDANESLLILDLIAAAAHLREIRAEARQLGMLEIERAILQALGAIHAGLEERSASGEHPLKKTWSRAV